MICNSLRIKTIEMSLVISISDDLVMINKVPHQPGLTSSGKVSIHVKTSLLKDSQVNFNQNRHFYLLCSTSAVF